MKCPTSFSPEHVLPEYLALIFCGGLFAWVLFKEYWRYRTIEVRPDRMIIDGAQTFWREKFETLPTFSFSGGRKQALTGIYGTRFVEFLEVESDDENDRMPQVLSKHLQAAIQQLWTRPAA